MNRRISAPWENGISFPLQRLYTLIVNKIWSDAESEAVWKGAGNSIPYQLWQSDPSDGGVLQLEDIRMSCAWCNAPVEIPLEDFWKTHTLKEPVSRCPSCGVHFNADLLSARYLRQDLLDFIKTQSGWLSPEDA